MRIKTLIIDNHDSFTNNLFQYIARINRVEPIVIKNDEYNLSDLLNLNFDNIVISPGPGRADRPSDFGICADVLQKADVPILGVCLGHQGIGCAFGGEIIHAPYPVHGQAYLVKHNNDQLFKDIPNEFEVIRYHSLMINPETLPTELEIIATTKHNVIMGVKHRTKPIWGIQFHPESIKTDFGYKLLENFMQATKPKFLVHRDFKNFANNSYSEKKENVKYFTLHHKKIDELYDDVKLCALLNSRDTDLVWLDSNGENHNLSRFSILGCTDGPHAYKVLYDVNSQIVSYIKKDHFTYLSMTIFDFIQLQLEKINVTKNTLPFNFKCGFVGYFGYELYRDTLNIFPSKFSDNPDAQFLFLDRAIVFDKVAKSTYLLALSNDTTENQALDWFANISALLEETKLTSYDILKDVNPEKNLPRDFHLQKDKNNYLKDIQSCLEHIKNGESYEICLTNKAVFLGSVDPFTYYLALRKLSKVPFSAFLKFQNLAICCSSMERFLAIDAEKNVQTKPIKGTISRGKTKEEDKEKFEKLRNDIKYQSENLMIVDLLRHDLGGVCEIGSVNVDKLMDIETYQSVHQMVSTVSGKLRHNISSIDCIKAVFPGGSMVGAPKKRTLQIIDKLENEARGIYSGAIGYISVDSCVDLNIVIRTAVVTKEKISVGIGGAIIALSDPEEEFAEIMLKLELLKKALKQVA